MKYELPHHELPTPPPDPTPPAAPPKRRRLAAVLKVVAALLVLGALGAGGVVGLFAYHAQELPKLETLRDYSPPQTTRVFGADGSLVGEIFSERRTVVPIEDVPAVMVQAFIAAEDSKFFEHDGVDPEGIVRAFIKNLRPGSHKMGASTITQQTVKTLLLSNERTWERKIKEAILASRLEQNFTKKEILHLYLNQIYFGNRRYGIEEAARYYFGKSIRDVTVGEAAVLAGIPKSPNNTNPKANPKRAKERQTYVLRRMVEEGFITEDVARREIERPIEVYTGPTTPAVSYYTEEVRRLLVEQFGETEVLTGGLNVETHMDPRLQRAAEEAVRDGLRALDKRQGWRGALGIVEDETWAWLRQKALALKSEGDETTEADAVIDLRRVDVSAAKDENDAAARAVLWRQRLAGEEVVVRVLEVSRQGAKVDLGTSVEELPFASATWARKWNPTSGTAAPKAMTDVVKPGDLVLVRIASVDKCDAKAEKPCEARPVKLALEQNPVVEGAFVAIDPSTRGVVAIVGGFDAARSPFNRATQAKRQPGSAFKPFVFAAALEVGRERALLAPELPEDARMRCPVFTPRALVYDTPEVIRDRWTGQAWKPANYDRNRFDGEMTLRKALATSKNTVAVKLVAEIGCNQVEPIPYDDQQVAGLARLRDMARRAGLDSPIPESLTAPLGTGEVAPLELVNAFTTFAANGRYAPPQIIRRVRGPAGDVRAEYQPRFEQPPPFSLDLQDDAPTRGLHPEIAYVTTDLLRAAVEDPDGTARSMRSLGRPIAAKTGTASENRDAWFVGYTPELVAGAWVGFDDHSVIGGRETGGRAAGPIWRSFMELAKELVEPREFEMPPGVVEALIDPVTGLLADDYSPYAENEVFVAGTEPTEASPPPTEVSTEAFLRGGGP